MENVGAIIKKLKSEFPNAKIALDYGDVFQLLVAVILSAQCTDERVNKVTPALFRRFPTIQDFAKCQVEELEKYIFSTGFYRNKAKSIKGAAEKVMMHFGGKVPETMEELLQLPGVARKTANVVLYSGFGMVDGIVVDTHVMRVSGRLGWVPLKLADSKNAIKIEKKLMDVIPKKDWGAISMLLILHGRHVCKARKPLCSTCPLAEMCPTSKLFL